MMIIKMLCITVVDHGEEGVDDLAVAWYLAVAQLEPNLCGWHTVCTSVGCDASDVAQLKGALAADDRLVHIRESSRVEEETTKPEIKAIELLDFPCSAWEMKSSLFTNHLLICSSDSWQNS